MNKIIFALLLAFATSLPASAGIFLNIPTIPGESIADGHRDEIDILSWGQSVANLNNTPVVLPLVITHNVDAATPKLIEAAIMGTVLESATLTVETDGAEPFAYFIIILDQPRVVSVQNGGNAGQGNLVEEVTLTCVSFLLRYWPTPQSAPIETVGGCGN